MGGCIADESAGTLAFDGRSGDHAMRLAGILATLRALAERGAPFDVFRQAVHMLVVGVAAADGGFRIAGLGPWVIEVVRLDGPKTLLYIRRVNRLGCSDGQQEYRGCWNDGHVRRASSVGMFLS